MININQPPSVNTLPPTRIPSFSFFTTDNDLLQLGDVFSTIGTAHDLCIFDWLVYFAECDPVTASWTGVERLTFAVLID